MDALGSRVGAALRAVFSEDDSAAARALLENELGLNTPGISTQAGLERVRLATLKCSGGSLDGLVKALDLAKTDYRDVLMAAGFGHDTRAHLNWDPVSER